MLCENKEFAKSHLGVEIANILFDILADIEAADNIFDLMVGFPQEIVFAEARCYSINISNHKKIILSNNDIKNNKINNFDWADIKRVKILKI